MPPRAVMDTNVLYAGLRSRNGASYQIIEALWQRKWTILLSQTIVTEYEEILKREIVALNLTVQKIDKLLDALCALGERRHLSDIWRPLLSEPDDKAFAQLAVEGNAGFLITHNIRHLEPVRNVGVNLLEPKNFLAIIRL